MSLSIEELKLALEASPDNIPLLLIFAGACLNSLQLNDATAAYQKVIHLMPENEAAKVGLAHIAMLSGKNSEAIIRLENLLESSPNCADANILLSRLVLTEGDYRRAQSLYDCAIHSNPAKKDSALEKELVEARLAEVKTDPFAKVAQTAYGPVNREDSGSVFPRGGPAYDLGLSEFTRPDLTFEHVGGMDTLKEEIRMKIIYPLQRPELFKAYGKKIGGGVLLYGPPGCGKTLISKATAGEIKANFISLGLHQVLDMYIGNSEKNLHEIFQLARQNTPCVLFFDEIDALAADRRDMRQSAGRTLINQFLAEMDGAESSNEGVLVIGATNAPWHIDPAFRRPGRFDRTLFVQPPDVEAREAIIKVIAKNKPVVELEADYLAKKTDKFSGADLKAIFDIATEDALPQAMKTGKMVPITTKDLAKAASKHKPTTKAWFESAKNYAMYSNQSGFYDDILKYLGITK